MGIHFNFRKVLLTRSDIIPEMRNTFPDMVKTFRPVKAKQDTECVWLVTKYLGAGVSASAEALPLASR